MLKVTKDFAQGQRQYGVGDVLDLHPVIEEHLIDAWPAFFERVSEAPIEAQAEVVAADVEAPPADKMVKRPRGRK